MDKNLRQAILCNPELLKYLDLHGIELAAIGFDIMLAAVSRDSHGHFYKDGGAPCPHSKGRVEPSETPESVKRKEEGVRAIKFVMRNGEPSEMRTASGRKVVFERGTAKYGVEHFKLRRFNSGDAKTDADFDKIIDGVSKAIANAEPYENRNCLVFDYKGYLAICKDRKDELIFISGYKKKKIADETSRLHLTLLSYADICYVVSPISGSGYEIKKGGRR